MLEGAHCEHRRSCLAAWLQSCFYRQIAQWYFAPLSEEQIEALAAQDLRALAEDDQSSYAEGYNDLYRALRLRHTAPARLWPPISRARFTA